MSKTELNNISDSQVKEILAKIRLEYQKQNISHIKLAEITGISRNTINNVLNNGPIPNLATVVKVAVALNMSLEIKTNANRPL